MQLALNILSRGIVGLFVLLRGNKQLEISRGYISAPNGQYCYVVGHVPKTVKNPVKHKNLEECERFIIENIDARHR